YQRIGDKNQAIYSDRVSLEDIWIDRETVLPLSGSHRLSKAIADVVHCFALDPSFEIIGRQADEIRPCILVFSNETREAVLPRFTQLVRERIPQEVLRASRYPIKCIGWVSKEKEDQLTLKSYHPSFERALLRPRTRHPSLRSHLALWNVDIQQAHLLNAARKSILGGLVSVLRREEITQEGGKDFRTGSLYVHLRENDAKLYEAFQGRVFAWSRDLYRGRDEQVLREMRAFVPQLLSAFGAKVIKSKGFIEGNAVVDDLDLSAVKGLHHGNVFQCPATGIKVEVGTVHSAKGETHLATLYVETFYQGKYESERLAKCFCGEDHSLGAGVKRDRYNKETIKVAYVGLSRPSHFLCVALHRDRCQTFEQDLIGWDVIPVE
ncbi:MAG TPA: hypothetical protein VM118_04390, partial [Acidobacteriota bacterium]|nr:hypothetical protein [Acidobacteriota bacterium]